MSVTPEQIAKLTDRHKIIVKDTGAPEHVAPVTLELWFDSNGHLCDTLGRVVRRNHGNVSSVWDTARALNIIDIIEPPHEFKYGDVIGHPRLPGFRAAFLPKNNYDDHPWLSRDDWETQEWADEQLANGWVIDPDYKQDKGD